MFTSVDIVERWGLISADFTREYGIVDLWPTCRVVSWRWFLEHVAGLASTSRFVSALAARPHVIDDPESAMDAVQAAVR